MDERDREYLAHMIQYAGTAIRLLGPTDAAGLCAAEEKLLAVSRSIQNVGEAANRVSRETRSNLAAIPWEKVIGMRHHLVHGYDDIRVDVIVQTIREDLPALIVSIRRALKDNPP